MEGKVNWISMLKLPSFFRLKRRKNILLLIKNYLGKLPETVGELETIRGQALLLILLMMAVVLTIVLSVVSRSLTDISITSLEEDALRAFSAAEAGVERALIVGSTGGDLENQARFDATVSDFAAGTQEFLHPTEIYSGQAVTIWFVSHDDDDNLICNPPGDPCFSANQIHNVCWGKEGTDPGQDTTPAIEVAVYYDTTQSGIASGDFSNVMVARATYDTNSGRDNSFTKISPSECTIGDKKLAFSTGNIMFTPAQLNIPCWATEGCVLMARVRLFYNTDGEHPVAFKTQPPNILPSQGKEIQSTGTYGEATRKIQVFQTYPELPFIFDAAVFSPGDLIHQ
jgi:hypothetical protein